MYPVHNVFRDTLGAAPRLVGGVAEDDGSRRQMVGNFYDNVIAFLHVHHRGEEELIFPLLRERSSENLALIDLIAGQHHDIDELVSQSTSLLDQWDKADGGAKLQCAQTLEALGDAMTKHLDDEETELLPLCSVTMTEPEWGALPGHAMAAFGGDKIWLILGLIRERMNDLQRDRMTAHMPPPAVDMWTNFGQSAFEQLMVEIGPLHN
jgi:iron-sulfur cluster repair protein YtfE (RIC family)